MQSIFKKFVPFFACVFIGCTVVGASSEAADSPDSRAASSALEMKSQKMSLAGTDVPGPIRGQNYQLVFQDNFDGPSGVPASKTRWSSWATGPRKDAFNVPDACHFDGQGHLVIEVRRNNGRIETGGITSQKKFEATHGYFECRCKVLNAPGAWSAFWVQSPTIGKPLGDAATAGVEMDVMEYFPGTGQNKAMSTAHWDGYDDLHHKKENIEKKIPGIADGFHTFAMKWDEAGYVFYIDSVESGRWKGVPVSNRPEYLILSCEVQKWSGKIEPAKLPASFVVDYVRVWQTPAQIKADTARLKAVRK
jgi:beta-glucanase (GH16 family)